MPEARHVVARKREADPDDARAAALREIGDTNEPIDLPGPHLERDVAFGEELRAVADRLAVSAGDVRLALDLLLGRLRFIGREAEALRGDEGHRAEVPRRERHPLERPRP